MFLSVGLSIKSFSLTGYSDGSNDQPVQKILYKTTESMDINRPLLSLDIAANSPSKKSRNRAPNQMMSEEMKADIFDYIAEVQLQQTVFVFDKVTVLKLASLFSSLSSSLHHE